MAACRMRHGDHGEFRAVRVEASIGGSIDDDATVDAYFVGRVAERTLNDPGHCAVVLQMVHASVLRTRQSYDEVM